jgi:hypothetical protein
MLVEQRFPYTYPPFKRPEIPYFFEVWDLVILLVGTAWLHPLDAAGRRGSVVVVERVREGSRGEY